MSDSQTFVAVNYGTGFGPSEKWEIMPAGAFLVAKPMTMPCGIEAQVHLWVFNGATFEVIDTDFVYARCGPCLPT